jgi:hypothetical protein
MVSMTRKSIPYNSEIGCPAGYHKRKSYTIKATGKKVNSRCVRSTTVYNESSKQFKNRVTSRSSARLKKYSTKNLGLNTVCPSGYLLRKPYVRKFQSSTRRVGYQVKRGNRTYRAYPKKTSSVVKASCIKDIGLPGTVKNSIGPLRKGDLSKYGYKGSKPELVRHAALTKAIEEYGALGTFRKLDAIAKLSVRRAPAVATIFKKDRDWVRRTHSLKAF